MKKLLITLAVGLMVFSASPVLAADSQNELPTWLTYTKEWVVLNLFTWKSESKVKVLDDLASKRVDNIEEALKELEDKNFRLIDHKPRMGAGGKKIAFLHPRDSGGVLVELCEKV